MKKLPKWAMALIVILAAGILWKSIHVAKLAMTVETDLFSQGQIEMSHGNYRSAIEIFETFLRRDPNHVPALEFKLQAELASGRLKEAELTAERIVKIEPTDVHKHQLADVYIKNAKEAAARQLLNEPTAMAKTAPVSGKTVVNENKGALGSTGTGVQVSNADTGAKVPTAAGTPVKAIAAPGASTKHR
jgi:predicted Zn-dependent protease